MPALWELCKDGKSAEVRAALAHGENVNYKGYGGLTALMWAVLESHNSIVKLLLDQPGVKVNEKNNFYGLTALHFAAMCNNPEGARLLLLHPAFNSANGTTNSGDTALMYAVKYRKKEFLVELVKHDSVSLDIPISRIEILLLLEGVLYGR